ncbi:hypothetical protein [Methylibium petroleiphilum]|uniref:Uncharacterized protein n=1 Tax=Methylibium petroleiphilum (strain ATCC BAA-1232 / LMG 22953 / PM1) TaxID=420662 RepID=A2SMU5_METPP|nr:hypothetical protein [Methylibium petroleiphilum]ABM96884.1 hypothetical protein Mpe_B0105 [Methylibium petroleiphilum PM1]
MHTNHEPVTVEQLLARLEEMTQYARTVGDATLPSLQTMFGRADAAIAAAKAQIGASAKRTAEGDLEAIAQRITEHAAHAQGDFGVTVGIAITGVVSLGYDAGETVSADRLRKALFENFLDTLKLDELHGSLDTADLIEPFPAP